MIKYCFKKIFSRSSLNLYEKTKAIDFYDRVKTKFSTINQQNPKDFQQVINTINISEIVFKKQLLQQNKLTRQTLLQFSYKLIQYFQSQVQLSKKSVQINETLNRQVKYIVSSKDFQQSNLMLNYLQMVKNICFTRYENFQQINVIYDNLSQNLKRKKINRVILKFLQKLWNQSTLQDKIRSVCYLQFMDNQIRQKYFSNIIQYIKYFKSTQIMILLYQNIKYNHKYSWQLLNEIMNNQSFKHSQTLNQTYLKMLFIQKYTEQISPMQQMLFYDIIINIRYTKVAISEKQIQKYMEILQSQISWFSTKSAQRVINSLISPFEKIMQTMKNSKNYLAILIRVYLLKMNQQILQMITAQSQKLTSKQFFTQNQDLFKRLFNSVISYSSKNISYQTNYQTMTQIKVNFFRTCLLNTLKLWPQVIFQMYRMPRLVQILSQPNVLAEIINRIGNYLTVHYKQFSLNNQITLKIFCFIKTVSQLTKLKVLKRIAVNILQELSVYQSQSPIKENHLELLYNIVKFLSVDQLNASIGYINKIFKKVVEKQIHKIIKTKQSNLLHTQSLDTKWLILICAQLIKIGKNLDKTILQNFINKKVYYLINSFQNLELFALLKFCLELKAIKMDVYQKIFENISTFIICVTHQKNSSFYLSNQYSEYYVQICKTVLDNYKIFKNIPDKNCLRIVQIIFLLNRNQFKNSDLFSLLILLQNPQNVIDSLMTEFRKIKFQNKDILFQFFAEKLKKYARFNKSLQTHQQETKHQTFNLISYRLQSLAEVNRYFSNIQAYKTLLQDHHIDSSINIPPPNTNQNIYKYLYIFNQIFKRIKVFHNYDFSIDYNSRFTQKQSSYQVDLQLQQRYMQENHLIEKSLHQTFQLSSIRIPKYLRMQRWKKNIFVNQKLKILPSDLYFNHRTQNQSIFKKMTLALYGSFNQIQNIFNEFVCPQNISNALTNSDVVLEQHGAAFIATSKDGSQFTLLCSTNKTYKLLYICAHLMAIKKHSVVVIRQNQQPQLVVDFLKRNGFSCKGDSIKNEVKIEQEEDIQQ